MKAKIVNFVLLATCLSGALCCAQEGKLFVDGIGDLKLGSSPEVLYELGFDVQRAVRIDTRKTYLKKVAGKYAGHKLYQLFPDSESGYAYSIPQATYHPEAKVFYMPTCELVPGITCNGVLLKYLNDSLFSIEVQNPWELENALTLKYGVGEEKERIGDCKCTILGAQFTKKEKTKTKNYNTGNPDVYCYTSYTKGYDKDCYETFLYYFALYNTRVAGLVHAYDVRYAKELREQRNKERLERLGAL